MDQIHTTSLMHHLLVLILPAVDAGAQPKKDWSAGASRGDGGLVPIISLLSGAPSLCRCKPTSAIHFFSKRCLRQKEWSAGASRGDGGLVPMYSFLVGAPLLTTSSTSLNTPMPVATLNGKPGLAATGSCQIHTFYCSGLTPTMLTKPWALTTSLLVMPCVPHLDVSSNV